MSTSGVKLVLNKELLLKSVGLWADGTSFEIKQGKRDLLREAMGTWRGIPRGHSH